MKNADKYYDKVYKVTSKLTKKLFGKNIEECSAEKLSLKKYFEDLFNEPVEKISIQNMQDRKFELLKSGNGAAFFKWAKYKTLCKILDTLESACALKTFIIKEYEYEC